jgi:ATP-dependent RNA helicase RhlE
MLDMGFIHDVRRVLEELPARRQNLLFSATLPPTITRLASTFLRDPVSVSVTPTATTVERIEQSVVFVPREEKRQRLVELLQGDGVESAIVFTRTKHRANRLAKQLSKAGLEAAAIHGNKSQGARTRTLEAFRRGAVRVLVATDLASRGLDVDRVTHVVNYELPNEPASYVHRIGRTGRAGRDGVAIAFCDPSERELLEDIERLVGRRLESAEPRRPLPSQRKSAGKPGRPQASRRNTAPQRRSRSARPARPDRPDRPGKGPRQARRGSARSAASSHGARRACASTQQATPSFGRRGRG